MGNYVLSCCSTADVTVEHLKQRNISYVCFHFELDGVNYMDDMGKSVPMKEFYQRMAAGAMTRTSQVSVGEYTEYFEPMLQAGKDVIHITLSSGISGTYNAALIAQADLQEKYPERKLYIIDSLAASSGYGLLMDKLADLRDEGYSIDELRDWVLNHRLECLHWFFTSDLTFFIRGGRVSKAAGAFGQMLNICPLMRVEPDGTLAVKQKIRTKKKVIRAIADKMKEEAKDGLDYSGKCYICHSACYEDARAVADLVEGAFPKLNGKVEIFDIGTTIGSHTGPGTVALFFWGEEARK